MLKAIALGITAGIVLAGPALALPLQPRAAEAARVLLVKHDKDEHGHGRKLGHFKHHGDEDWDRDERGGWSSGSRTYYVPVPVYPPPAYYGSPGYGSSYPPPAYYGYGSPY